MPRAARSGPGRDSPALVVGLLVAGAVGFGGAVVPADPAAAADETTTSSAVTLTNADDALEPGGRAVPRPRGHGLADQGPRVAGHPGELDGRQAVRVARSSHGRRELPADRAVLGRGPRAPGPPRSAHLPVRRHARAAGADARRLHRGLESIAPEDLKYTADLGVLRATPASRSSRRTPTASSTRSSRPPTVCSNNFTTTPTGNVVRKPDSRDRRPEHQPVLHRASRRTRSSGRRRGRRLGLGAVRGADGHAVDRARLRGADHAGRRHGRRPVVLARDHPARHGRLGSSHQSTSRACGGMPGSTTSRSSSSSSRSACAARSAPPSDSWRAASSSPARSRRGSRELCLGENGSPFVLSQGNEADAVVRAARHGAESAGVHVAPARPEPRQRRDRPARLCSRRDLGHRDLVRDRPAAAPDRRVSPSTRRARGCR